MAEENKTVELAVSNISGAQNTDAEPLQETESDNTVYVEEDTLPAYDINLVDGNEETGETIYSTSDLVLKESAGNVAKRYGNDEIIMTDAQTNRVGYAWIEDPISTEADFTASFEYKMGEDIDERYKGGDGIVFNLSTTGMTCGADGYNMGFVNRTDNYGVELDCFCNTDFLAERFPDGESEHIAIIYNNAKTHIASLDDNRIKDNDWHTVNITYKHDSNTLTAGIDGKTCVEAEVALPSSVYVGLTAATGAGYNVERIRNFALNATKNTTGHYTLIYSYNETDKTATVTGCNGNLSGTLKIPDYAPGRYMVTSIGNHALRGKGMSEVVFPAYLKEIGNNAFADCNNLSGDLEIPNSVEKIRPYAFESCKGLTGSLKLSNQLTSIEQGCFYNCGFTGTLTIPEKVTEIGAYAFGRCNGLERVVIGEGVNNIGGEAFSDCSGIESLILGNSVKTIGDSAFGKCISLSGELVIPDGVESIGTEAFAYCTSLSGNLIMPSGVILIGNNAFIQCNGLTSVTIPDSVVTISGAPNSGFEYCSGLMKIENESNIEILCPSGHSWWNKETKDEITSISNGTAIRSDYYEGKLFNYWSSWAKIDEKRNDPVSTYEYDDLNPQCFLKARTQEYDPELTRLSIRVAMAAFDSPNKRSETRDDSNIKELMSNMGFKPISTEYRLPQKEKSIGTAIGMKKLDANTSLILIAVRGAGYEAEWGSNFNVSQDAFSKEHYGFNEAADIALNRLNSYLSVNSGKLQKENVKVWICGYSRAAATANLISARLIDKKYDVNVNHKYIDDLKIEPHDVYGFCFECPQNTTETNVHGNYDYICNIVNPLDFVPMVAMNNNLNWRYTRYGKTYSTPSKGSTKDYSKLKKSAKQEFDRIVGSNKSFPSESPIPEEYAVRQLASYPAGQTENPSNYRYNYQDDFIDFAANFLGKNPYDGTWIDFIEGIFNGLGVVASKNPLTILSIDHMVTGFEFPLNYHWPELCLAWVDTLDSSQLRTDYHTKFLVFDIFNELSGIEDELLSNSDTLASSDSLEICIYDHENNLVGRILDNEPQEVEGGGHLFINDAGQVISLLPGDETYHMIARNLGDSKIACTIQDIQTTDNNIIKSTTYPQLEVNDSDVIDLTLECVDDGTASEFELKKGDTVIQPISDKTGDQIVLYSVTADTVGDGCVTGIGVYSEKQLAKLVATPAQGYKFDHWEIEDESVSSESVYEFEVNNDTSLTAVFTQEEGLTVSGLDPKGYSFTSGQIKPEITVSDGSTQLVEKRDYTLLFKNNTKVYTIAEGEPGFDPKKAPSITVTGKGNYDSKDVVYFKILPQNIGGEDFGADDITLPASTKPQKIKPVLYWNGKALKQKTDYTCAVYKMSDTEFKNPLGLTVTGEEPCVVRFTGTGNFTDTRDINLTFTKDQKLVSSLKIDKVPAGTYTGSPIMPEPAVRDGSTVLVRGVHYSVTYASNVNPGTGYVIITGIPENGYAGTKRVPFKINAQKGSKAGAYDISPDKDTANRIQVECASTVDYVKGGAKPTVTVKYTDDNNNIRTLTEGIDYKLSYKNNTSINTNANVVITGKGSFKGSRSQGFAIKAKNISTVSAYAEDKVYQNKANIYATKITLTDSDGKKLSVKKDYQVDKYTYLNDTEVTVGGNKEIRKAGAEIGKQDILSVGTVIEVTLSAVNGSGYTGTAKPTYRISNASISSAKVTIPTQTYTGKPIELDPTALTVTVKGQRLTTSDFEIVGYENNTNKGTAKVTIRGKGNYGGYKTQSFKIKAKGFHWWWRNSF